MGISFKVFVLGWTGLNARQELFRIVLYPLVWVLDAHGGKQGALGYNSWGACAVGFLVFKSLSGKPFLISFRSRLPKNKSFLVIIFLIENLRLFVAYQHEIPFEITMFT